jgi:hypothetical protein
MSTSSPSDTVSIVVGANGAPGSVERCLGALEGQAESGSDVEVIVCEATPSDDTVRTRFSFARFETRPGLLVPELWRTGIELSSGTIVALTISPMEVAGDWVATIRDRLGSDGRADALGGAIDVGDGLGPADWAEYFCRYAADLPPFPVHESLDLPGDNAAYRRDRLDEVRDSWRDGFWEPEVHRALKERGATLVHDPALLVRQGRSAGFAAFCRQRLVHGREYGRQRGLRFSRPRNVVGIVLSIAVPWLLLARTARLVFARRRHRTRLVASLPPLLVFDAAWALGEARGHLDALRSS